MRRVPAILSTAVLLVAAGCTMKDGGTATPGDPTTPASTAGSTTAGSTTRSSSASGDVPAITGPELDLSKVGGPCEMLKADQLSARGVTKAGTQRTDPAGPACQWRPDDRVKGTSFTVGLLKESKGLDGIYANRERLAVFEPIQVAGYPAVNTDATDAKGGACSTAVGVAEGEGFVVQIHVNDTKLPEYKTPCSVSSAIAETVVGNLKG